MERPLRGRSVSPILPAGCATRNRAGKTCLAAGVDGYPSPDGLFGQPAEEVRHLVIDREMATVELHRRGVRDRPRKPFAVAGRHERVMWPVPDRGRNRDGAGGKAPWLSEGQVVVDDPV